MASIVSRRQVVAVSDQPDVHGLLEATESPLPGFRRFTATGGTQTTIVSAVASGGSLSGASADIYVGHFVRCVGPRTSNNYNLIRRVVGMNSGTDTITVDEAFPDSVANNDQFEGWEAPFSFFCEDTGGGANTDINDASRNNKGTDYWDNLYGDYSIAVAGTIPENEMRLVSSFTTAGGILATAAQSAIPAVGDLFDVVSFPEILGNVLFDTNQAEAERPVQLGGSEAFDREPNARGSRSWSATVPLEWKGSGTGAGAAAPGVKSLDNTRMLEAFFSTITSTGDAVVAQAGTAPALAVSAIDIANGNATRWPVGSPLLTSGQLVTVQSTAANGADPDSIVPAPYLYKVPVVSQVLYAGISYYPKLTGHRCITFIEWDGELKSYYMGGFLQGLALEQFTRDQVPRLNFKYAGGPFHRIRKTTIPDPTRPHVPATAVTNAYITLGSSTKLNLISWAVDWGLTTRVEPLMTGYLEGYYGYVMTDWNPTITVVAKYDGQAPQNTHRELERFEAGQTFSLQAQHDERPGFTTGIFANVCEWSGPKVSASEDLRQINFTARPLRSGLTGMPKMLLQTA